MREIKFRAWCVKDKTMEFNIQDAYDGMAEDYHTEWSFGHYLNDSNYLVMQYTGLYDSQGKEIFECDIVKLEWMLSTYIGFIRFEDGAYQHVLAGEKVNCHCFGQMYADAGEVIGNIYENPELLK